MKDQVSVLDFQVLPYPRWGSNFRHKQGKCRNQCHFHDNVVVQPQEGQEVLVQGVLVQGAEVQELVVALVQVQLAVLLEVVLAVVALVALELEWVLEEQIAHFALEVLG